MDLPVRERVQREKKGEAQWGSKLENHTENKYFYIGMQCEDDLACIQFTVGEVSAGGYCNQICTCTYIEMNAQHFSASSYCSKLYDHKLLGV